MLTYGTTKNLYTGRSKTLFKKFTMFLIASIGTRSQVFNSGWKIHIFDSNNKYKSLPELQIKLRDSKLQSVNHKRKELELQDIIDNENDSDWYFVPKTILDRCKRIIPRDLEIGIDKEGKLILSVSRNAHLGVKVLWKDRSVSWIAGDTVRLQNPFLLYHMWINISLETTLILNG